MKGDQNAQAPKRAIPLPARLVAWPFIIAGCVVVLLGLLNVLAALTGASWPVAEGTITSWELGKYRSAGPGSSSTLCRAKVRCQFTANGKSHKGGRVAFGDHGSNNVARARDIVIKYPVGAKVSVSYNSAAPGKSVLAPGIKVQDLNVPALGMLLTLAGPCASTCARALSKPPGDVRKPWDSTHRAEHYGLSSR
ncbi:MAG: DUF3592 domain-containing protein [Victivallales bacterium]|jgi:hypothetical protein|nr:DUF3592 domain-containing protein [Victivallales bacterium]MBT7165986.1 DUF3592 domain-containing protein [Victivallales bacterium]MBT7298565.1 DUF3592 domain-containing protein [Victivallales bacterium]